ncbi:hypothetical protein J2853_001187 [Streptosporangium lutulentum]|uniref:Uncharacterized protein n=1 Tax=Streptosporangium lutulentum TaxID=1461250 RepID=A0ABT9Q5F9_9ACTN|nr:hypothetical protein [Streptosporangium lutulentum]
MEEPLGSRHPAIANAEPGTEAVRTADFIEGFATPVADPVVRTPTPQIRPTNPLTWEPPTERSNGTPPSCRRNPTRRGLTWSCSDIE